MGGVQISYTYSYPGDVYKVTLSLPTIHLAMDAETAAASPGAKAAHLHAKAMAFIDAELGAALAKAVEKAVEMEEGKSTPPPSSKNLASGWNWDSGGDAEYSVGQVPPPEKSATSIEEFQKAINEAAEKMAASSSYYSSYVTEPNPLVALAKKIHPPGSNAESVLRKAFPGAMKLKATCPGGGELCHSGYTRTIAQLVPHLNDAHKWKTAQIAEWLENTFTPEELTS